MNPSAQDLLVSTSCLINIIFSQASHGSRYKTTRLLTANEALTYSVPSDKLNPDISNLIYHVQTTTSEPHPSSSLFDGAAVQCLFGGLLASKPGTAPDPTAPLPLQNLSHLLGYAEQAQSFHSIKTLNNLHEHHLRRIQNLLLM